MLNPSTPAEAVRYVLPECDMVLLMSVNPGAGGQSFIQSVVHKIRAIKEMALEMGADPDIEIDGGINLETGRLCVDAGANVLVAGSSVFKAANPMEVVQTLRNL